MKKHQELKEIIETYQHSHDDGDTDKLEKAMNEYCSPFDIRNGYIQALLDTVNDQIANHMDDTDEDIQDIINIII